MQPEWIKALIGGAIIGLAVSLMLFLNGRTTGISGIVNGALTSIKGNAAWRIFFLFGLLVGGFILFKVNPVFFENTVTSELWTVAIAGILVGFGTTLGSGCTSGHGVCGLSRFSLRSLVATLSFMFAGVAAVYIFKNFGVL